MKREDYEEITRILFERFKHDSSLASVLADIRLLIEEDHATPSCVTPESDIPFGNLVKDPDLMFTCLEYAHDICLADTPDEVLTYAKRIHEWVK